MKAILISIRPQWVELILNFIKKDEIRKGTAIGKAINKLIEEQGVAPMLLYCTKNGGNLVYGTVYRGGSFVDEYAITRGYSKQKANEIFGLLNGKVVAQFNATAEEIKWDYGSPVLSKYVTRDLDEWELCDKSCLTGKEMIEYLGIENEGTDIHINDLEIFDKPKELSEFKHIVIKQNYAINGSKTYKEYFAKPLTRAPQSWCYCEV